jgi:hypothetical protein
MRVIFLDIDGVLNCKHTPNPRKFPYIVDQKLLECFRGLVARADAAVVLSSTWRYDPAGLFNAKHWGIPAWCVNPVLSRSRSLSRMAVKNSCMSYSPRLSPLAIEAFFALTRANARLSCSAGPFGATCLSTD